MTCFSIPRLAVVNFLTPENEMDKFPNVYRLIGGNEYNQPETYITYNSRPNSIDGYTPKNKKLLQYPYLYLAVSAPNTSQKIYRYEDFENATPEFGAICEVSPNPQVCIIPQNYRGIKDNNIVDMVSMTGFPTLSSRTDYFNSWLAQNSSAINLQMQQESKTYAVDSMNSRFNGTANTATSFLSGDIAGGITSGINTAATDVLKDINHEYYIKNQLAQVERQTMVPDTANLSSSNSTLIGYNLFENNLFYIFSIKAEFAKRIDKYFDMYGYLTNTVKIPNINNRPNWNYVKTININLLGDIPEKDMLSLKSLFNNGITLWHNPNTFLDYSQNNK